MSGFNVNQLKEEIYKHISEIEKKLHTKIDSNQSTILSNFESFSTKINNIINRNKIISDKIALNKNQFDKISELESYKNKVDSMLITHEIRINNSLNDIEQMKIRYDKIISDNILIQGYVGQSSKFRNLSEFNLNTINEMDKLKNEKDIIKNDLKEYKIKLENLTKEISILNESAVGRCNIYIDNIKKEIENLVDIKIREIYEKIFEFHTIIAGKESKYKEEFNNIHTEIQNNLKMKEFLVDMINSYFNDQNNIIDDINKKVVINIQDININKKNIKNCDNKIFDINKFIKEINFSINNINRFITKIKKNDLVYDNLIRRSTGKQKTSMYSTNKLIKPIITKSKSNLNSKSFEEEERKDKKTRNKTTIDKKTAKNFYKITNSNDYSDGEINEMKFGTSLNNNINNNNYQIKKNFNKIFGFSDNIINNNITTENLKENKKVLTNVEKELNADLIKIKNFQELKILSENILSDKNLKKKFRKESPKSNIKHHLINMKLLSGSNSKKNFVDLYNFTNSPQNNHYCIPRNINLNLRNSSSVSHTKTNSGIIFEKSNLKKSGSKLSKSHRKKIKFYYKNNLPTGYNYINLGLSDENSINPDTNNGAYVLANKKIENGNIIKLDSKMSLLNIYNNDIIKGNDKKPTSSLWKTLSGFRKKSSNSKKYNDTKDSIFNSQTEYH